MAAMASEITSQLFIQSFIQVQIRENLKAQRHCPVYGAFDLGLAVSVPLPIVTGIFVLLWFQSRLT